MAIGDKFGIPKGENTLGRLVAALRMIGFDEIYDTNFGADLTVMEESKELVERLESGENLPLFTSCCPAWVKFCENRYPQFRKNLSTCRSPQAMFGALLKEEARIEEKKAAQEGTKNRKTVVISIMYCKESRDQTSGAFYRRKAGCRLCTYNNRSNTDDSGSWY